MSRVLHRYLARELLQYWLLVTLVLWLVLVAARFSLYLGQAAAGELPAEAVVSLLALKSVGFFVFLMPLGLFLGLLALLGRLNRDYETLVLGASGMGPWQWYRAIALPVLAVTLLVALLSAYLVPHTAQQGYQLRAAAQRAVDAAALVPGRFHALRDGRWLVYAQNAGPQPRTLENVFVYASHAQHPRILVAQQAVIADDEARGGRYLVLKDGYQYQGTPGRADYRMLRYREYAVRLQATSQSAGDHPLDARPTSALRRDARPAAQAEWHMRMARPLSVPVLALIAVPLARTRPGSSRYRPLWLGVLVFTLYFNLLGLGQLWLEQGRIPLWTGLWWAHGLMLAMLLAGMRLASRRGRRRVTA
ncbi:MAG: LPS export ABC transporter permease LptF [Thiogranum sp.]|nr:LPS export ABC transporter permease LptF [Thiogranum sp.]